MPKVSVIIPVYNAADSIIRCINSLLSQTLDDMEFIFVDDHGQDNSMELVKQHIMNHGRRSAFVFAATDCNSGPGEARNVGIKMAKGEYVAFCDSDDWVESTMYGILFTQAVNYHADICCGDIVIEQGQKQVVRTNQTLPNGQFLLPDKKRFLTHYVSYFTTFIYKKTFLEQNHIFFPLERSAEDSCFLLSCLLLSENSAQVHQPLYHYMLGNDSLSQQNNEQRYLDKLSIADRILEFAKGRQLFTPFQSELEYIYIKKGYLMAAMNYLWNASKPQISVLKGINEEFTSKLPDYHKNSYYKQDAKVRFLVFLLHDFPKIAIKTIPFLIRKCHIMV